MATSPTTPPTVNPWPTAPSRTRPLDFPAEADAFLGHFPTGQTDQQNLVDWQNDTALEVFNNANESATSATNSANSAAQSAASADESQVYALFSQQAANFLGDWSAATGSASRGNVVVYNSIRWQALVDIPDITASEPGGLNSDWLILSDQNIVLTGGNYNIADPTNLPDGHKVNFVRAKGVTNAVVVNSFGNFKTDLGDYDQVIVGSNYGFTATAYNGNWEI